MDIERSKHIPISEILGKMNVLPTNPGKNELSFISPWRDEKTPSFFVNVKENVWFDHGEGIGGDPLKFACLFLERTGQDFTVSDGLRWLRNLTNEIPAEKILPPRQERKFEKEDSPLSLRSNRDLDNPALINYLGERGIPLSLARKHFRELVVFNSNSGKRITCLGFPNEEGGFELRNPFFKACLRPKSISFIRGREVKPEGIHLFEGSIDYLSSVAQLNGRNLKADVIVLNSVSCIKQAMAYIHQYGYRKAYTWMDNDAAGEAATKVLADFFTNEPGLQHIPMNRVYHPHKDVNAWHVHCLNPS
ncbi:toprim domain-containing protein [Dyadobacter jiangsuensis]